MGHGDEWVLWECCSWNTTYIVGPQDNLWTVTFWLPMVSSPVRWGSFWLNCWTTMFALLEDKENKRQKKQDRQGLGEVGPWAPPHPKPSRAKTQRKNIESKQKKVRARWGGDILPSTSYADKHQAAEHSRKRGGACLQDGGPIWIPSRPWTRPDRCTFREFPNRPGHLFRNYRQSRYRQSPVFNSHCLNGQRQFSNHIQSNWSRSKIMLLRMVISEKAELEPKALTDDAHFFWAW